jgi:cytochrome c2
MYEPESKVTLSVIRDGEVVAVEVVLKAVAVISHTIGFDAFEHFHGHRGKQEMQNCAACHTGGKNGRKDDGLQNSFDNYLFFHGTPGNAVLNKCSSCHVKSVKPLMIRGQTP